MLSSKKLVNDYMKKDDWRVQENSNSPYCFGALNKYLSAEVSKNFWLKEVYTPEICDAYRHGFVHIHDLSALTLYCCGYSLRSILTKGITGVPNIPSSEPAKHFMSVLNQVANLTTIFQNEIAGAVAFNNFDTLLAPFVKEDKLSYKQVKQYMQNFVFSINSNSRAGAEPSFSNITFDLTPDDDLLNQTVICAGKTLDYTYKECQPEIDMINRAFCELMLKGDAEGKPFGYPIPTYNINKRFDWDNPNNYLLWEMCGKYGTPYFANFINSDLDPSDVRSMCPMTSDTKVLVKTAHHGISAQPIGQMYNNNKKDTYMVWGTKGWINANTVRTPRTKVYKITLSNGSQVRFGENHLQPVKGGGVLKASELRGGMWIPFNKKPIDTDFGCEQLGYAIGAYLGDGSRDNQSIIYSLCAFEKDDITEQELVNFWNSVGFPTETFFDDKNVRFVRVKGDPMCIIKRYVRGDNALNKGLTKHVYNSSLKFKIGLLRGFAATDGSREKKRLYTSSNRLRHDMEILLASLGRKCLLNHEDNRDGRLGSNTNYRIDYPERTNYGDLYQEDEDFHYYQITDIAEELSKGKYLYCFETDSEDHLFMLANGLITHNCRLRINMKELQKKNGGLFGSGDSTGSIGVCTINLPRIAHLTKDKDKFFEMLYKYMATAKDSLEIKRTFLQKEVLDGGMIPAFKEYVGTLKNHFCTIGYVGLNEAIENLTGKDIVEDKGLALEILNKMRDKIQEFQIETGHLYNLESSPAESTAFRLAKKDVDEFGYREIAVQGSATAPYYTNSCHIPVKKVKNVKQLLDHQNDLQVLHTGGTVVHIFTDGPISGQQAKSLIRNVCEKYHIPYVSHSPLNTICPTHGLLNPSSETCPECGAVTKKYQRITGYIRNVDHFNPGKLSEFKDRNQLCQESLKVD